MVFNAENILITLY